MFFLSCPAHYYYFLSRSLQFFSEYEKLLHSENYVTKRQSLKVRALGCVSKQAACSAVTLFRELFKEGGVGAVSVGFLKAIHHHQLVVTAI